MREIQKMEELTMIKFICNYEDKVVKMGETHFWLNMAFDKKEEKRFDKYIDYCMKIGVTPITEYNEEYRKELLN